MILFLNEYLTNFMHYPFGVKLIDSEHDTERLFTASGNGDCSKRMMRANLMKQFDLKNNVNLIKLINLRLKS